MEFEEILKNDNIPTHLYSHIYYYVSFSLTIRYIFYHQMEILSLASPYLTNLTIYFLFSWPFKTIFQDFEYTDPQVYT